MIVFDLSGVENVPDVFVCVLGPKGRLGGFPVGRL
jgi:hypothetical protein